MYTYSSKALPNLANLSPAIRQPFKAPPQNNPPSQNNSLIKQFNLHGLQA